jgi:hypothetical protein
MNEKSTFEKQIKTLIVSYVRKRLTKTFFYWLFSLKVNIIILIIWVLALGFSFLPMMGIGRYVSEVKQKTEKLNKKIEHFYSSKISSDNFLLLEEKVI